MSGIADIKQDAQEAWNGARLYHAELRDIFAYTMPFRAVTTDRGGDTGSRTEGQRLTDQIFDGSGIEAAFNFAGTLQSEWMPLNQPFARLEAGPLIADENVRKQMNEGLDRITSVVEAVLHARAPATVHEMCLDLFAGTGALLLLPGDEGNPVITLSVPIQEIALESGPRGDVWRVTWRRKFRARDIPSMWPRGKISDALSRAIKENRNSWIEITQHTRWDDEEKVWKLYVWSDRDKDGELLWEEAFRVSPWVLPRFLVVPGESYGRGLGHLILPFVRTANKTRELALTAAAYAVMGIFTYRHDGVFNPSMTEMSPLAFWPVLSNGGAMGKSIDRLPIPDNFDVTSIVMSEERETIRRLGMDDDLPDQQDAVRSATEVAARMRRYSRRWGGVNTRLGVEWIVPMVRRTVDILEDKFGLLGEQTGKARSRLTIDQLRTKVNVVAPAMSSLKAARVEQAVNYLQILMMLFGQAGPTIGARVEKLMPDIGRWSGLPEEYMPSTGEIKEMIDQVRQAAAAAAAQQQSGGSQPKPPTPGQLAQQYVNGRGQ